MKPARSDHRFTIAETARRVAEALEAAGEDDAWIAIRDFLDDYRSAPRTERPALVEAVPATGDARFDAYLAALIEHFAVRDDLPVPAWTADPNRFLARWWFPTQFRSLHAMALVQSPAAFRRRGIFIDDTEFQRV